MNNRHLADIKVKLFRNFFSFFYESELFFVKEIVGALMTATLTAAYYQTSASSEERKETF